jgi:hypothetical protein
MDSQQKSLASCRAKVKRRLLVLWLRRSNFGEEQFGELIFNTETQRRREARRRRRGKVVESRADKCFKLRQERHVRQ